MSPPQPSIVRRWVLRVLGALGVLGVVGVTVMVWMLGHLDSPFVKRRVQSIVRSAAAVDVDYAVAQLQLLHGLHLTQLHVRSHDAELLTLGTLDAAWTRASLFGKGPRIQSVRLQDVVLSVPASRTEKPETAASSSGEPLSRMVRELLQRAPPVGEASLERGTVVFPGPERLTVRGLSATVRTQPWRVQLGTPAAPLTLTLTHAASPAPIVVRAWVTLEGREKQVLLGADARVTEQGWRPEWKRLPPELQLKAQADVQEDGLQVNVALALLDDLFHATASARLPDSGPPRVAMLKGEVALAEILQLLPEDQRPLRLYVGQLGFSITQLVLGDSPHLEPGGTGSASLQLRGMSLHAATMESGELTLAVRPTPPSRSPAALEATLAAQLDAVSLPDLELHGLQAKLELTDLALNLAQPLATRGQVEMRAKIDEVVQDRGALSAQGLEATLHGALEGHAPYALDAELRARKVHKRNPRLALPLHATLAVRDLTPDLGQPLRSQASAQLQLEAGLLHAQLHVQKAADTADFSLKAEAEQLGEWKALLGPSVDWERAGLSLESSGRLEKLSPVTLQQRTHLKLAPLAIARGGREVTLQALELQAQSHGDMHDHAGEVTVSARGLEGGDQRAKLTFSVDTARPSARVQLAVQGEGEPWATLHGDLSLDRPHRALLCDLEGKLTRPVPLTPFLSGSGVDPRTLEVGLAVKGTLGGLLRAWKPDGTADWSPHPLQTVAPEGTFHLTLKHLLWSDRDRRVNLPGLDWSAEVHTRRDQRTLKSELTLESPAAAQAARSISAVSAHQTLDATLTGDPTRGELELTQLLEVHALQQGFSADYPVGELRMVLEARRDRDGLLRIARLLLDNPSGGTSANLRGGLDLAYDRRRLSLRGDVSMDLSKLWKDPRRFKGTGKATLAVRVSSGNLETFRTVATVKMSQVKLELPDQGITLEQVDGEVPLVADVTLGRDGVRLLRDATINPYTETRFGDQHPLLNQRSFVSIAKVTTPWATMAPLAGNLQIQQNIFSVGQLDMGLQGGRVTGQAVVEWNGADSSLEAHVRATDVKSSRGEPFDGNIALVYSARDRSLDGRADVLKIGRSQLYGLLDIQDPTRADASLNRIRRGLELGYPDKMRVSFNHGFASVKISFGGLARLLTLDEIRGIPVGPLIDKVLARAAPAQKVNQQQHRESP